MAKPSGGGARESDNFVGQDEILLGVLAAVERDSQISQRTISRELGVALGLANAYLKRCVRKGWIKVQQVPRVRYVYYLTPQGFAEKSRLAGEYFSASFTFFRRARAQMSNQMSECDSRGWKRIAFAGISDLVEVGVICAHDYPVTIVAVVDPSRAGGTFCGLTVKASVAECGELDAVVVTDLTEPEATYRSIIAQMDPSRVLAPQLLRIALPKTIKFDEPSMAAG